MQPKPLLIEPFGQGDALDRIGATLQVAYLRAYLAELQAASILEEQQYFDRDYLAEFAAFYGVSCRGYANVCRRLHFFSGQPLTRELLMAALAGEQTAAETLQDSYLGFTVVRPISKPIGRTVLRWLPDLAPATPRVVEPARDYNCHVAGLRLRVRGLAWQQQDSAVGACATVALWSMLHSSAFDDYHAIPTTAEITRLAHRTASLGARIFPSAGLNVHQICEAIKESGLAPVLCEADIRSATQERRGFTRERFAGACAALIRSGFPVLIAGDLVGHGGHAVCAVGFRECAPPQSKPGGIDLQDGAIQHLYIHDDNLGPSVRFEIVDGQAGSPVELKRSAPTPQRPRASGSDLTSTYPRIRPTLLIAAVPDGLRTSPDALHEKALSIANILRNALNQILAQSGSEAGIGLSVTVKFPRLASYFSEDLPQVMAANASALARVRLELVESVPPMSLHVGVVRIGTGSTPVMDVLCDTTDSDSNPPAFCHIAFDPGFHQLTQILANIGINDLGTAVAAY